MSQFDTKMEKRRLRILSALYKELEKRGFEISADRYRQADATIQAERYEIDYLCRERTRPGLRPFVLFERVVPTENSVHLGNPWIRTLLQG